jgi:alpha-tubulin suppressor-like RCC1 family protein
MRRERCTLLALALAPAFACGARTQLSTLVAADAQPLDASDSGEDAASDAVVVDVTPSITASSSRVCVVGSTGRLKCWGNAPIGNGSETLAVSATDVGVDVARVGAMNLASCMLRTDGKVLCWGRSQTLELGLGLNTSQLADDAGNVPEPTWVAALGTANLTISVGALSACALSSGAVTACWGEGLSDNQDGLPALVTGLSGPVNAMAEGDHFQCALLSSGRIQCWGDNSAGQLGIGAISTMETIGAPVAGIEDAVAVAAGTSHACALLAGGGVSCWGDDSEGELGDNAQIDAGPLVRTTPIAVANVTDATLVRAGGHNTCVVTKVGAVRCWGGNSNGSLGDGTNIARPAPIDVVALAANVVDLAMGRNRTCALLVGGGAKCWGVGPLGDGESSTKGSFVPVDVVGLP